MLIPRPNRLHPWRGLSWPFHFSSSYLHQEFQALFPTPVGLCHSYACKHSPNGERGEQISADLALFFFPDPYPSPPPPDFSAMVNSHAATSTSSDSPPSLLIILNQHPMLRSPLFTHSSHFWFQIFFYLLPTSNPLCKTLLY